MCGETLFATISRSLSEMRTSCELSYVVGQIKSILYKARSNVVSQVNGELLKAYWNIGRIVCEYEQSTPERADYGKQIMKNLSKELTREFGKGFSVSNLQFMRRFYLTYSIQQTVSVKLGWSHYCELLTITDSDKINAGSSWANQHVSELLCRRGQ